MKKKSKQGLCTNCGHDMGKSRCRPQDDGWLVRCGKCKTEYKITIKLPPKAFWQVVANAMIASSLRESLPSPKNKRK